jgi:hypothetical protein
MTMVEGAVLQYSRDEENRYKFNTSNKDWILSHGDKPQEKVEMEPSLFGHQFGSMPDSEDEEEHLIYDNLLYLRVL